MHRPGLSLPLSFSLPPSETPSPATISPHRLHQSTQHPKPTQARALTSKYIAGSLYP
ncbi:hypothetical protein RchiOBHm_Chr1g0319621 [Rosa chinensis]|uniref:Uncharacterized protein n=1 Tax=Rosa chinensis TaxID=74649 RepID=A0A2P6S8J9_ROSCH|nr:hypothetical protein RchiOBHm_Chr1g0319621 [Rosa chinensis]